MLPEDPHENLALQPRYSSVPWPASSYAPTAQAASDDTVDLTQLWAIVASSWRLVVWVAGIILGLAVVLCFLARPMFRSVARMYMGEGDPTSNAQILEIATGSSEASGEIEVLRSRALVRRAVLSSGMNVVASPPDWTPPSFARWLLSGRDLGILDVGSRTAIATNTSLHDDILEPRKYLVKFTSSTEFILYDDLSKQWKGKLGQALSLPEASLTLVAGPVGPRTGSVLQVAIEPVEDAVERALRKLEVSSPKTATNTTPSRVLMLEFTAHSRRVAVSFLEHLMRGYLEAQLDWKTEDASAAESFVTDQLQTLSKSLDNTQSRLADYRAANRVVMMENEANAAAQKVGDYESQRVAAELELSSLTQIKKSLQNQPNAVEAYMVGEASDTVLQRMAASLADAREKLSAVKADYSDGARESRQQQAQVDALLVAIRNYVDGRIARSQKQIAALNHVISISEARLRSVPGAELELAQMGRETEVYNRMYNYLLERKQQAGIVKASTVSKNRILDHPYVPAGEDSPKLWMLAFALVIGLLLGAAIAILRVLFSAVVRRENDVRVVMGPLQLFARVPTRLRLRESPAGDVPVFDVLGGRQHQPFTESLRSLRTNLYRALPGEHGKVLLITSPCAGDGKTTATLSLAAMLAADNRRVLVVDCDLRHPNHHGLLGIPAGPGLSEILAPGESQSWRRCVRTVCLASGSFDSISAGSAPDAERLSDGQLHGFLGPARSHYDFILLDSASYPEVSDPLVLAPLSDFVLSVVRLGHTSRKLAEDHVSNIFPVARGHAVALNNAPQVLRTATRSSRFQDPLRRLRPNA